MTNKNYHEWQEMVGSSGRYKIRLSEDARTIEVIGVRGRSLLKFHITGSGYLGCSISYEPKMDKTMLAHQLSYRQWVEPTYFPNGHMRVIDHIDCDKTNNHPNNLRIVTCRENISKERSGKKGLPTGVSLSWAGDRYRAIIEINKKKKNLGYYPTSEAAAEAYQKAAKELAHV